MKIVLFLTACINPNGMSYTVLSDAELRKRQYIDSLKWYISNTNLNIVFVENSNTDLSKYFVAEKAMGRLEILFFDGNNYKKSLGKGYGEANILQFGFNHSLFLRDNDVVVVKVTGRFICKNINEIVGKYNCLNTVYANIGKDDWNGNIASSSFVIAPKNFWERFFLINKDSINDSKRYHFEHLLYDSICFWKSKGFRHKEFWILPSMEGISGTSGKFCRSQCRRNYKSKILYVLHLFGYRRYLNPFYRGNPNYVINEKS